ncbi:MAG: dTMP kinase [bacterium]
MGKLINLEGCDSAGKTTQIKFIKEYFENIGKTVKHIHFPMYGHNMFSELISSFLRGEYGDNNSVDPIFVSNIYSMDRYMYKEQILKDLEEYDILLVDRYVFSNVAYQVSKVKDDYFKSKEELMNHIIDFEFNFLNLPYPDLILFLDVPIFEIEKRLNIERVGEDRDYLNGKQDVHEKNISYQEDVRSVYLSLHGTKNYKIINTYDKRILEPKVIFESYKEYLTLK